MAHCMSDDQRGLHEQQGHQEGSPSNVLLEIQRRDGTYEASGCIAGTQPSAQPTAATRDSGSVAAATLPGSNPEGGRGFVSDGCSSGGEADELRMRRQVIASSIVGNLLEW